MLLQYNIPISSFRDDDWNHSHYRRLLGSSKLRKIVNAEYSTRSKGEKQSTVNFDMNGVNTPHSKSPDISRKSQLRATRLLHFDAARCL